MTKRTSEEVEILKFEPHGYAEDLADFADGGGRKDDSTCLVGRAVRELAEIALHHPQALYALLL